VKKIFGILLALALALGVSLVAVPVRASGVTPDRVTVITNAADRLVETQSTATLGQLDPPDYGWDWKITGLTQHSATKSAYNMYGVVILGLLDAYEETDNASYLAAATGMANHMTNNLAGNASNGDFYKQGAEQESAGSYDYQFLMRYAEVSGNSSYSDYAIALWTWNKANTAMYASPEALNDALLGWAGSDPGAASWMLAAYGMAIHLMGDATFATGCADLIEADLDPETGEEYLVGDYMALAECLEFLSELDSETYSGTIDSIITALVDAQQADGCWNDGYAGTFQDTAYPVRALAVYGGIEGLNAARKGAAWLVGNQLGNGGWIDDSGGSSEEYSEQDAEGLRALVATEAPVTVGTNGYYSIQDAIDAANPGDTISVAAGTYNESVTVNKSLTLEGGNAGIPATEARGPESIIDAQLADYGVFIIEATTTATLDGFTVRNYEVGGILAGAFSPPEDDPFAVHILNNVVEEPSSLEDAHNNNIQVGDGTTGTIIGNEVSGALLESPDWSGSGIIVAGSSDVLVSDNYVHNCEGGIQIVGYAEYRDAPAENNIIEYNLVEDNESGIVPQMNSIGTIIRYNDVLGNDEGIAVMAIDYSWEHSTPSGTQIHYNNIVGNVNYGVESGVWGNHSGTITAEEVDASANWWGSSDPAAVAGMISGDVDFTPLLDSGTDADPATPGFQPSLSSLTVHTLGSQSGSTGRIQEGVNLVSGSTVNVAAGTYDEQVVIDKSLTLEGAGDTTIIQPSGPELTATTSIPWIGGGTGTMSAIVSVEATGDEVTIKDVKIDGSLITSKSTTWVGGLVYLETSGKVEGVTVNGGSTLPDRTAGIFAAAITESASLEVTGCTVQVYTRAGIYALGGTIIADYHHNQINGPGPILGGVPNGMFFLEGATGSATYNTVTDLGYTGETWRSTGIGTYSAGDGIVFSHNEISNVQNAFALSQNTNGTTVEYNTVHDCHTGVKLEAGTTNNIIRYNDIRDNTYAMRCGDAMGTGNEAHFNNFVNNTGTDVEFPDYVGAVSNIHTTNILDATYNWWGSSSGPSGVGPGTGDSVSDYVDFEPWLREVPTVTTQAATEVRFLFTTVNMNYTVGGYSPVQVRFAYKKSTDTEWSYTAWVSKSVDGTHAQVLSMLTPGGQYAFKAQLKYDDVVDGATVIEGDTLQFNTSPIEGCFIATAAYGTPSAEQIDVLREFRDTVLLESTVGSQFVALYYQLSPPVAEFIAGNELLRTMVRELLVDPIVWVVEATEDIWQN